MLEFKKALEKCEALTTDDTVLDNPFCCIEAVGYLKAFIEIYQEDLVETGTLDMVKSINAILLVRSTQLMMREMKSEDNNEK